MKKHFRKILSSIIVTILSLLFIDKTGAMCWYGPPSRELIFRMSILPIASGFLLFVISPIIGLLWYKKKGGKRKWPKTLAVISISLFFILLIIYSIYVFNNFI